MCAPRSSAISTTCIKEWQFPACRRAQGLRCSRVNLYEGLGERTGGIAASAVLQRGSLLSKARRHGILTLSSYQIRDDQDELADIERLRQVSLVASD